MVQNPFGLEGLSNDAVKKSRQLNGRNITKFKKENSLLKSLKDIVTEPMFLLLLATSAIYFILGEIPEAIFMTAAILLISAISFYQDSRSRNALEALKEITAPRAKLIRNGILTELDAAEIVIGDLVVATEGHLVPADGKILQSADFSVNESMLTGESFSIYKTPLDNIPIAYQGTQVVSGQAVLEITEIGSATRLGKISGSMQEIEEEATPLQKQIKNFVRKMAAMGILVFILVWVINYIKSGNIFDSLLKGLTLAMSVLPEEIPVAFSTFMALGAMRLMRLGIIVKNTRTVETLGAATVICTDKTGTITENRMELARIAVSENSRVLDQQALLDDEQAAYLIRIAMFASESVPFDPMEIAIHDTYAATHLKDDRPDYSMIHEYPLEGKPPMMTHVFSTGNEIRVIAAKGAPEAILSCCRIEDAAKEKILSAADDLAKEGYRILAVGESDHTGNEYPKKQQDLNFRYLGLLAFYDPPKPHIKKVFDAFYLAGIKPKIITGDNAITTMAIARQAGFKNSGATVNADDLNNLSDKDLEETVIKATIFTRMFPEAKLKIINALKKRGEIVAMTGDGVNDAPALKAAHIGIAMGKRGSALARSSASIILTDDDFSKMTVAIAMGRRIYTNLKKAIQYIISIHIPIILSVFIPLIFGWIYPNIFTPVHVIFLELIMGPTCSIIYENEPLEANSMEQAPRKMTHTFLSWDELSISIWQGLIISAGTLATYWLAISDGSNEDQTRTLVFVCLVCANIFLTLVNRSFYDSFLKTFSYRNWMLRGILLLTIFSVSLLLTVPALRNFFRFGWSNWRLFGQAAGIGILSVLWFEIYKWKQKIKFRKQ
ncbi:MAG: cation-translocating P-type ATPase [Chitinophagaceae bacterium]